MVKIYFHKILSKIYKEIKKFFSLPNQKEKDFNIELTTSYYDANFQLSDIDLDLINNIFEIEQSKNESTITKVLSYTSDDVDFLAKDERAFPGEEAFLNNGYYKKMLKRYFFSGAFFCKGKKVLDSCCGLGWGTYIVSKYALLVDAFDIEDQSIKFCKENWENQNISWYVDDVFKLEKINNNYDVALALETIEHFNKQEGDAYIGELSKRIKKNGILIGSSYFPKTRDQALEICKKNPFHLYIFTKKEICEILGKYFSEYHIINDWMFIAVK